MEWKTLEIKTTSIVRETERAYLIRISGKQINSAYRMYQFWHPKKCVRFIGDGKMTINYTDDWTFKVVGNECDVKFSTPYEIKGDKFAFHFGK